jgi:S1-C subfamily serine protease
MTRDIGKTSPGSGVEGPRAPDGRSRPFRAFLGGRPLALLGILVAASWGSSLPAQEERDGVRKTYETVRPSFLAIEITLRKKTRLEKAELEDETLDADDQRLQQLREAEQPLEAWGVAVDKNLILMAEKGLKESDVERIRVTDSTGASFEAALAGVGRRHDFVLLKPTSPRELTPLSFAEWTRPALGETFHVTFADRVDRQWHLNVSPYILTNAPLVESPDWFCIDVMRPGSVISDRKGETVGIALDQYLWVTKDGRSSFLGKSILADDRLGDLEKRFEPFRKPLQASVKRIEILFRSEKSAERYMPSEEPRAGKATVFGVAVDDRGTLFVPEDLGRDAIRKIDDVAVLDEGTRLPAAFVGSFRAFGGFLVRAEGLKTTAGIVRDGKAPPAGEILFTATFEDRFGASRIKFDYNRLFRVEPGLGGVARIQPRKRIKEGSFLLDSAGRIVGVSTVDRKEEDLDDVALEASRERYYTDRYRTGGGEHLRRLLFFSEIAPFLDHPTPQFDPRAVPMTKKEEKKLVWLGVEYQEISKPVADALGIQGRDQTNDGRRGLVVTEVYAGSPAEKAGLRPDDVLLTLRPEGESPRDLVGEPDRFGGMSRGMPYGPGRGGFVTPWKPTRNYLTTMLTEVGASKKVTFQVLRAKALSDVSLTLDYAPIDYDTAERYKDEMLGLTAKELTYEVRQFHKLELAASGVVVARVESGGKADVGKLQPLSIVTRVNNVAVRDLEHFRQLVTSTKNVTMTTIAYGQTKLVELARD